MTDINKAIDKLKALSKGNKDPNIGSHVSDLVSTVALLELSSPSVDQFKTLSGSLREQLQPLYMAYLQPTLCYAIAVLKLLHEKITPLLRSGDPGRANLWESSASSVVAGILDYLEQHQTKKARETVASAVYPAICALYFTNGPGLLASYDGNAVSNAYMLLGETVAPPGVDASILRDRDIGGHRLGRTIAETRNYLALESIINLLGSLIPPSKSGKEKQTKFLQEVFDETSFKDSKRILQALETIKRDWSLTAMKIIHLLAESDIRFPQPFQLFRFQVDSSSLTTSDPMFVDNRSFVASLDQGGIVESLVIPFATVGSVAISAVNGSEMKVKLFVNKPPLLGNAVMPLPQRETYLVSFSISKGSVNNFGKALRERRLKIERPAQRKLSQAPGELLPEIVTTEDDKKWEAKAAKLTNMAQHGTSDPPVDQDKFTSSPRVGHPSPSNRDPSAFVDKSSDKLPSTVFLDTNGNFSVHPPWPTDNVQAATKSNNSLSPRNIDTKKRPLHVDDADVEAQSAKRARQGLDSVPPSPVGKQRTTRSNRKGLDVDFDAIPKAEQNRPKARATAMKGKNVKVAPRPRPIAAKKNKKRVEDRQVVRPEEDAEKTLVEQVEQHGFTADVGQSAKGTNTRTAGNSKNENPQSKKSKKAPWEMQDLTSVKVEMTKEATVSFDPPNEVATNDEEPPSGVVDETENHDHHSHNEGIFGHRWFAEPLELEPLELPPSPPLAPAKSGQIWIDLTNSPEPAISTPLKHRVQKTPSFDRTHVVKELVSSARHDRQPHIARINKVHKPVEKFPLLPISSSETETASATPPHAEVRTKVKKFTSPIRGRQPPLGGRSAKKVTRAVGRNLEEKEVIQFRAIPKEQKSGAPGPSRRPHRSEEEDDPDLRIAVVLGEINKALLGNIQQKFTGVSSDFQLARKEVKSQVADELGKMNNELFKRYNGLVELHEGYVAQTTNFTNALEVLEKTYADSVQSYRDMLQDFRRNSLRKKFAREVLKESTMANLMRLSKLNLNIDI